jgi:abortive infection bacteriophage resistance protein
MAKNLLLALFTVLILVAAFYAMWAIAAILVFGALFAMFEFFRKNIKDRRWK